MPEPTTDQKLSKMLREHVKATSALCEKLQAGAISGRGTVLQAKESAILLAALRNFAGVPAERG